MGLTRLDCHIFRGERSPRDISSFVALNPHLQPSRVVFAGSSAVRESVGSQVAYRMALDYFVQGVESCFTERGLGSESLIPEELTVKVVEDAFRLANTSVYSFGHKLSAGGRMAATLLGIVIDQGRLATGRVGFGSVYLLRKGQLYPFFETPPGDVDRVGDASEFPDDIASRKVSFVGANALVDVELASVDLQEGDVVCAFSRPLTTLNETLLFETLETLQGEGFPLQPLPQVADRLCKDVFTEPETLSFAFIASIGPEAIYCAQPLESVG